MRLPAQAEVLSFSHELESPTRSQPIVHAKHISAHTLLHQRESYVAIVVKASFLTPVALQLSIDLVGSSRKHAMLFIIRGACNVKGRIDIPESLKSSSRFVSCIMRRE